MCKRSVRRGIPLDGWFYLLVLSLPCCFTCINVQTIQGIKSIRLIENVPFYSQKADQCGPASLAGILNYWGIPVTPEEISSEIYSRSAKGTLNLDMILYARAKGLKATHYQGDLDDLRGKIDLGYPLIVLVDHGFFVYQQNHFMVVLGYYENGIIANSGKDRLKPFPVKNFLRSWERTKFWTLLITPYP